MPSVKELKPSGRNYLVSTEMSERVTAQIDNRCRNSGFNLQSNIFGSSIDTIKID